MELIRVNKQRTREVRATNSAYEFYEGQVENYVRSKAALDGVLWRMCPMTGRSSLSDSRTSRSGRRTGIPKIPTETAQTFPLRRISTLELGLTSDRSTPASDTNALRAINVPVAYNGQAVTGRYVRLRLNGNGTENNPEDFLSLMEVACLGN